MNDRNITTQSTESAEFSPQYFVRLVGTVVILLGIFIVSCSIDRVELPAYNPDTFNEKQEAAYQKLIAEKKKRMKVSVIEGKKAYLSPGGEWSYYRPAMLDENDEPLLSRIEMIQISKLGTKKVPRPAWMMQDDQPIDFKQHNFKVVVLMVMPWLGLMYAFVLYMTIFHRNDPVVSRGEVVWSNLFFVLILGTLAKLASQPVPYFIAFVAPCVSMFLLWALSRALRKEGT